MTMDVRTARKLRKITQLKLAIAAGVERARISLIEGGARTSKSTADKIAKVLGYKPETLFKNYADLK
jgi:transcriptional regulator with XRE-family HTH domain